MTRIGRFFALCAVTAIALPAETFTTLLSFDGTEGQDPQAALVQATNVELYGTAWCGGAAGCDLVDGTGTVFGITVSGTLMRLHSFCSQRVHGVCGDGQNPDAGLIQGSDGNFYGTTEDGGSAPSAHCSDNPCGTIFEITPAPSGTLTTLYSFCVKGEQCTSGGGPVALLSQATNGDFYGTTTEAGSLSGNNGTVFRLSTGLGPFVKTLPASSAVGAAVKILGTDLTGAAIVTFNGTAAAFTVVSATEITTTVPAGATSGEVQVTAPSGTFSSNVNFLVIP